MFERIMYGEKRVYCVVLKNLVLFLFMYSVCTMRLPVIKYLQFVLISAFVSFMRLLIHIFFSFFQFNSSYFVFCFSFGSLFAQLYSVNLIPACVYALVKHFEMSLCVFCCCCFFLLQFKCLYSIIKGIKKCVFLSYILLLFFFSVILHYSHLSFSKHV